MARQTTGSRARQAGKSEEDVKAADDLEERGQRTIYVDGKPHVLLGLDDLEWGEIAELEDYMGHSILGDVEEVAASFKGSLFLYYLGRRRDNADFTLAEAERTPINAVSQAPETASDAETGETAGKDPPTGAAGG